MISIQATHMVVATHIVHIQLLQSWNLHRCGHGCVYPPVIQQMAENLIQGPRLVWIQDERRGRWDWEGQSDDAIKRATKTTAPVTRMRVWKVVKEDNWKLDQCVIYSLLVCYFYEFMLRLINNDNTETNDQFTPWIEKFHSFID